MTKILDTIRKLVGAGDTAGPFDSDLLIHINSAFSVLNQIGAGPEEGFICDDTSAWSEFLPISKKLEMVKTYVYLKVRLIFDPPASSAAVDAMSRQVTEYEERILIAVDPDPVVPSEGGDI